MKSVDPESGASRTATESVPTGVTAPTQVGSEAAQHRLLREAQALARLSHPNVIAVHDTGTRFTLARALWKSGRDRTRARALAGEALGGLGASTGRGAAMKQAIEGWLARPH